MPYQLPDDSEKAAYLQKKFSEIAPKYNLFNDLITCGLHRYWKKFVVRQVGVIAGGKYLDLCCGTADIALRLRDTIPQGSIFALDFSPDMLEIARNSPHSKERSLIFLQADATLLPFSCGSMDAVTVGYGLRNVNEISKCLAQILNVLKPGGVLVSLDVGKVRVPIISEFSQFYILQIVPRIGKLLYHKQDIFDYLSHSTKNYPNQETLKQLMLASGFKQVDVFDFLWGATTVHVAYKP